MTRRRRTVRLSPMISLRLSQEAKQSGCEISEIAEKALDLFFRGPPAPIIRRRMSAEWIVFTALCCAAGISFGIAIGRLPW